MSTVARTGKARFSDVMGNSHQWASIGELLRACDEAGYWTDEFLATTTENAKKSHIRKMVKVRDEAGWPLVASVTTANEDGELVQKYKQESLFDREDYRQVVAFHGERSNHHRKMAVGYAERCFKKFDVQLPLDFGDGSADPGKPR